MGVTNQIRNPYGLENVADELDLIEELIDIQEQARNQAVRHAPKRGKKFQPLYKGEPLRLGKNGVRRARRSENMNYLLGLAESEESHHGGEITDITELLEPNMSAFSELFAEKEKMKIWNDFINCSEEEQSEVLAGHAWLSGEDKADMETMEKDGFEMVDNVDKRTVHPAFTAEECYKRIDSNLKSTLRKKQIPWGCLKNLEEEVTSFFLDWPTSVYISKLSNSYERLLLHALCQYLDLKSHSFDDDHGTRRTQVENKKSEFVLPTVPLSTYLECRH